MAKYMIVGTYHVELNIETELTGKELVDHYAKILKSEDTKKTAGLIKGVLLSICKCGNTYGELHTRYCGNCGEKLLSK
jgi:hypothetical protein